MATQGAYGPPGAELQRLYDADAVDRYVAQLQSHIEDLQTQVADAVRVAHEAQHKATAVGNAEAILGRALLAAQRAADESIADAERQAGLILADARREADRLLGDVRADAQRIVDEAHETVEAVFAALAPQREEAPDPVPTLSASPLPPPPVAVWAAPNPAEREPDEDEDEHDAAAERWDPPATAGWHENGAGNGEGTIVDLRPGWAGSPDPGATSARSTPAGPAQSDWGMSLGGTGTEGTPLLALALAPDPPLPTRPGAELLDRWRLARNGPASLDDELLSRQGHLDSLADGSYVSQLRHGSDGAPDDGLTVGDAATLALTRGAHPASWQPKPPPVGPPVVRPARRFGLLGRRHR